MLMDHPPFRERKNPRYRNNATITNTIQQSTTNTPAPGANSVNDSTTSPRPIELSTTKRTAEERDVDTNVPVHYMDVDHDYGIGDTYDTSNEQQQHHERPTKRLMTTKPTTDSYQINTRKRAEITSLSSPFFPVEPIVKIHRTPRIARATYRNEYHEEEIAVKRQRRVMPDPPPLTVQKRSIEATMVSNNSSTPGPSLESTKRVTLPLPIIESEDNKFQVDCSICLERLEPCSTIYLSNCHHYFHPKCCFEWLRSHGTCPLCRGTVDESIKTWLRQFLRYDYEAWADYRRGELPIDDEGEGSEEQQRDGEDTTRN